MDERPVAIVLGGTFPHAEVLRKLKSRGYYAILIDYYDNPVAAEAADEHICESAMDYAVVLRIAKERKARLILSPCLDQQMVIAVSCAEALGLPHPFSSVTAKNVTNKRYMKKIMTANGISTAKYYLVDEKSDLREIDLDYPVVVKPVDNSGSAGVQKIESAESLKEAVSKACTFSRTGDAVVEEFKEGREVSTYTFVTDKRAEIISTMDKCTVLNGMEAKCYGGFSPAELSESLKATLEKTATELAGIFGLDNTPLFFQSIVDGENISVIEFSPRLGGDICYRFMKLNTGFDMLEASIDSYLQKKVDYPEPQKETKQYIIQQVQGRAGILDHVEGLEESKDEGLIDEFYMHKTKGMKISTEKSSSARVAVVMSEISSRQEGYEKLDKAFRSIKVVDPEGKDITDRRLIVGKARPEEGFV